ncbi:MAG: ribonuclease HII [Chloroflexota bacterium]
MALFPSLVEEQRLWSAGHKIVAGLDEAGRGAWAGPIIAAAVVLPPGFQPDETLAAVRDSKLLPPAAREALFGAIREAALAVGVGLMPHDLIDCVGIGGANRLAMMAAVEDLGLPAEHLLIDYFRLPAMPTPQSPIVDGDALCFSIAAASIIAKVTRDRLMVQLDAVYPGYAFAQHKGYGTVAHRAALTRLGLCAIHRRSFAPMCELCRDEPNGRGGLA